jgi:hypothetical protein
MEPCSRGHIQNRAALVAIPAGVPPLAVVNGEPPTALSVPEFTLKTVIIPSP